MGLLSKEQLLELRVHPPEKRAGIYVLFKGEEVVYVGQTVRGMRRVFDHIAGKDFDTYSFVETPVGELDRAEAQYILAFDPIYNHELPEGGGYYTIPVLKKKLGLGAVEIKRIIKQRGIQPVMAHRRVYYPLERVDENFFSQGTGF